MNHTEFKGFNLNEQDGRVFISACGGYPHDAFKKEGYGSMSAAKGAITKHVNARNAAHDKGMEQLAEDWAKQDAEAVAPKPSKNVPGVYSGEITLEDLEALPEMVRATTPEADAESDKVMAQLRYHGFIKGVHGFTPKQPDSRSRNKREGRYGGTLNGSAYRHPSTSIVESCAHDGRHNATRKQRKAAKLANKA